MRKFTLLLVLLMLPLAALANDYAWVAASDIRDAYPEDCQVTIILHSTEQGFRPGLPRIGWNYSDFITEYGGFTLIDEFQIGSHATGACGPLGEAIRRTYSVTLTGADKAHLDGIRDIAFGSRTLKVEIPADTMLTGPEEGSPYNSRVYYVRVYGEQESITCTARPWLFGKEQKLQVMLIEPRVWVLYAVDMYIPPLAQTP